MKYLRWNVIQNKNSSLKLASDKEKTEKVATNLSKFQENLPITILQALNEKYRLFWLALKKGRELSDNGALFLKKSDDPTLAIEQT